jgi:hypothetical protein
LLAFNNKPARCLLSLFPPLFIFPIPCSNVSACFYFLLFISFPKACELETSWCESFSWGSLDGSTNTSATLRGEWRESHGFLIKIPHY